MLQDIIENLRRDIANEVAFRDMTIDDYQAWLHNPVTRLLFTELNIYCLDQAIDMAANQPHDEQTQTSQTLVRGEINGMQYVLTWQPYHLIKQLEQLEKNKDG